MPASSRRESGRPASPAVDGASSAFGAGSFAPARRLADVGDGRLLDDAVGPVREVQPKAAPVMPLQYARKLLAVAKIEDQRRLLFDLLGVIENLGACDLAWHLVRAPRC